MDILQNSRITIVSNSSNESFKFLNCTGFRHGSYHFFSAGFYSAVIDDETQIIVFVLKKMAFWKMYPILFQEVKHSVQMLDVPTWVPGK